MRIPATPPEVDFAGLIQRLGPDFVQLLELAQRADRYLPWDEFRRRDAPQGVAKQDWWAVTRFARQWAARPLPFTDDEGTKFHYGMPDSLLKATEDLGMRLSASLVSAHPRLVDGQARDRYLVRSLMEESISSSQLEGAATTRAVAKEMLRNRRAPRDRGEQMIANNFAAMELLRERVEEPMSVAFLLELHQILTAETLKDPAAAGRIQQPGEQRIVVADGEGNVLHRPPPAEQLPERLQHMVDFANGLDSESPWMPKLLRPLMLHFMAGFNHFFVDGNGRLARALFYWAMLREGFWLAEFVSISQWLYAAPTQYGLAYLYTEQEHDLTYFFLHQIDVLRKATDTLDSYVRSKAEQEAETLSRLDRLPADFNHRQRAIIAKATRDPSVVFTVTSHATSQNVTSPTAQSDLDALVEAGFLVRDKRGRRFEWTAGPAIRNSK